MRPLLLAIPVVLVSAVESPAQVAAYSGPRLERHRLADGVYAFVFDNPLGPAVDGTALVIINDDDVVVVDAQNTYATTRAVIAEIRKLTNKPVRYLINTHWHGDHNDGNQVYADSFPALDIIAHPATRDGIRDESAPLLRRAAELIPTELRGMESRYAAGKRRDGTPLTASDSALYRELIALYRWLGPQTLEIRPLLPTFTVADSLVLHRGERTIVIRWLGRGNTRGDLTVYLPRERIIAVGDLLVNPVPYSFGSYLGEWTRTLAAVRAAEADVIVPGHGAIQRDRAYLDLVSELLASTLSQARTAVAKGLNLEATRRAVDLSVLRDRFTRGDPARQRAFDAYFVQPAVERAWLEARGELDRKQ